MKRLGLALAVLAMVCVMLATLSWSQEVANNGFYQPVVKDIRLHGGMVDIGYAIVTVSTWGQDGLYKVTVSIINDRGKTIRKSNSRWFRWNGDREMEVELPVGGLHNMGYHVKAVVMYAPYIDCER